MAYSSKKNKGIPVPGPGDQYPRPSGRTDSVMWLIKNLAKVGGVELASKGVEAVTNFFKERDYNPIQAGEDYETEGMTDYTKTNEPNRNPIYSKSDAPMPTITGQEIYDVRNKGVEGETINKPPITGDRTATSYDHRTDSPSTQGYVNIDGQIYKKGTEPKGSPAVASMHTETSTAPDVSYKKNDPERVDIINNDDIKYESDEANKNLFKELGFEDINKIEDFETRGAKPRSEIGY